MLRIRLMLALAIAALSQTTIAAPTPRGQSVAISCAGPLVAEGRTVARANKLKLGQDPAACFGKFQIYDGPDRQFVAVTASKACPKGKLLDVYGRSRAGSWYSYFEKPICGGALSVGPKNPWGDWMLTVDGKHYDSRGAYYVLVNY